MKFIVSFFNRLFCTHKYEFYKHTWIFNSVWRKCSICDKKICTTRTSTDPIP